MSYRTGPKPSKTPNVLSYRTGPKPSKTPNVLSYKKTPNSSIEAVRSTAPDTTVDATVSTTSVTDSPPPPPSQEGSIERILPIVFL